MTQKEKNHYDIIHIVRIFHPNIGGMENLVHEIANRQVKQGKRVLVITSDLTRDGHKVDVVLDKNYEVYRVESFLLKGVFIPKHILTKFPACKTLHCHGMDPMVDFLTLKIKFQQLIISPHGGFFHTPNFLFLKKIYFNTISKFITLYQPKYYCISQNDIELVSRISENVYFMGCGSASIKFNLGSEGVLTFGRIAPNKCINDAIKVFEQYFESEKFVVAGPNPEKLNIELSEGVEYLGPVTAETLEELINQSKYFISMSSYEGLGMALIEAIKGGLIPIVRNIDAYKHIDMLIKETTGGQSSIKFVDDDMLFETTESLECSDDLLVACADAANTIWCWDSVVQKLNENNI